MGDGKPEKVAVQIPEKETEEMEEENAQVKQSPEEMRQKELKEVIEQYNREKQDPDYYYLPDSWDGQTPVSYTHLRTAPVSALSSCPS